MSTLSFILFAALFMAGLIVLIAFILQCPRHKNGNIKQIEADEVIEAMRKQSELKQERFYDRKGRIS